MLLEGSDAEDALLHIASTARDVGDAQAVALALPGVDGALVVESAVGHDSLQLVGAPMPAGSRAYTVLQTGTGLAVPSLQTAAHPPVLPCAGSDRRCSRPCTHPVAGSVC